MAQTTDPSFRVHLGADSMPPPAIELFGNDAERDWGDATPVAIGAGGDEGWSAGLFMLLEREGDEPIASIRQLIVRPAARGRGLGGFLLRRAQTLAAEHGCKRIRSTAGFGCPDHLGMYQRLGYGSARGQGQYLVTKALDAPRR